MKADLKLVFRHNSKEYVVIDKDSNAVFIDEDGSEDWYWWIEGNGGCDCNRSIWIHRTYPEFPEMSCGNTIELIDYEIIK